MRKFVFLGLGVLLAGMVTWAGSGVTGSVHDFSNGSSGVAATNAADDQICKFCHAPHNNNDAVSIIGTAPLWNHESTSTAAFGTYGSPTFDGVATINDVGDADNSSFLCMSCHDGTIEIGSLFTGGISLADGGAGTLAGGGTYGGAFAGASPLNFSTDLTNDHPVNFDAATAATADGGITIGASYPLDANDIMHCSTCHDPHDGPATGTNGKLLRGDPSGSQICLDCHTNK